MWVPGALRTASLLAEIQISGKPQQSDYDPHTNALCTCTQTKGLSHGEEGRNSEGSEEREEGGRRREEGKAEGREGGKDRGRERGREE